jgi:VanZ family protein
MTKPPWKNFLIPALCYAAILSISLLPRAEIERVDSWISLPDDKVIHLGVYTGFGFVLGGLPFSPLVLGAAGSLLGAVDEQIQRLAPGRDVSLGDWLADILGISLGLALRRRSRR